jgi:hypothetical protein
MLSTASAAVYIAAARVVNSYNSAMNLTHIVIFAVLIGIIAALGSALFSLSRSHADPTQGQRMFRALALRVALSVGLFLLLLLGWRLGWIQPHTMP